MRYAMIFFLMMSPPVVFAQTPAFTDALSGQSGNWKGVSVRTVIKPGALSGTAGAKHVKVKIATAPGTASSSGIVSAWLGEGASAGNEYNFDGNQVQLKLKGATSVTGISGAQSITFDDAQLVYDPKKKLVLSIDWASTGAGPINSFTQNNANVTSYYKYPVGSAGVTTTTMNGYAQNNPFTYEIDISSSVGGQGGTQANCLPQVTYPGGNVDDSNVHAKIVAAMDAQLTLLSSKGCPPVPDMPHGINGQDPATFNSTIAGYLRSANQTTQHWGLWWEQVTNSTGSLRTAGFGDVDRWVAYNTQYGFTPILNLTSGGGNPAGVSYANKAAAYDSFKTFAVNMVKRYPSIEYWELWNEVDGCTSSSCSTDLFGAKAGISRYAQGQNYAQMLSVAVPAMRAANPNIKIVLGGLGGIDTSSTSFSQAIADAGATKYIDIWNIHVYGTIQYRVLDEGILTRTWMNSNSLANMPLILSEWGDQNTSQQLTTERAAYLDIKKYGIYSMDVVYSFNSPDGYALFPDRKTPNTTERYFISNP